MWIYNILVFILFLPGYYQNSTKVVSDKYQIDTSIIAIIPLSPSDYDIFKNSKPADLSEDELGTIEILLTKCINEYNPKQEKNYQQFKKTFPKTDKNHFIIDLKRYKRQYIAAVNEKGEKEVWVNCFCRDFGHNWRKEIITVDDGGNCFFELKINLTKEKYYDLMVNGVA